MTRHPTNLEPSGFGGLSRAELMSRVHSRGNKTTEVRMVALLRRHGLSGWSRRAKLPGRPDFVWPKHRVAVFVDVCFWYGHDCGRNLTPKKNAEFWEKKFAETRRRDDRQSDRCRAAGTGHRVLVAGRTPDRRRRQRQTASPHAEQKKESRPTPVMNHLTGCTQAVGTWPVAASTTGHRPSVPGVGTCDG
jgi:DNA mismatch endonuclease, patch repair protein